MASEVHLQISPAPREPGCSKLYKKENITYVDGSGIWNGINSIIKEFLLDARGRVMVIIGELDDRRLCVTSDTTLWYGRIDIPSSTS